MPETLETMSIDQIFDMYAEILKNGFQPTYIMTTAPEACRMYKASLNEILDPEELEKIEITLVPSDQPDRLTFHIGGPPELVKKVLDCNIQPTEWYITEVKE